MAFSSLYQLNEMYNGDLFSGNVTTMGPGNLTTPDPACNSEYPFFVGFIAAAVSIIFYGTNFAPVKKYDTGDGMFFQWILCISIWCVGLVVNIIRDSPQFYPLAMLGGLLWETGNICVVPIIKTLGLGLGLCIWGMTNLLSGWATGRFGLFGVKKDPPDNLLLNDFGVTLAVSSAVVFAMVKNTVSTVSTDHTITVDVDERKPLLDQVHHTNDHNYTTNSRPTHDIIVFDDSSMSSTVGISKPDTEESDVTFIDRMSPTAKRIMGISLSLVSGIFYGQMFTPAAYIQYNYEGASQKGFDYVFSTFSGILASSTVYFLIYCVAQKNKPKLYPRVILPGFVSGLMWGIATTSWFIANQVLSESVAFPIISTGPAVLASLLGVFVFNEIKGRRNIIILLIAFTITITGAVLCGLSKKGKSC